MDSDSYDGMKFANIIMSDITREVEAMPRPTELKNSVKITVRLPGELACQLFDEAVDCNETMSSRVRDILDWYFNEDDEGE